MMLPVEVARLTRHQKHKSDDRKDGAGLSPAPIILSLAINLQSQRLSGKTGPEKMLMFRMIESRSCLGMDSTQGWAD